MFTTSRATFAATVAHLLVTHHATTVDHAIGAYGEYVVGAKLAEQLANEGRAFAHQPSKGIRGHWAPQDGQVPVGCAIVHQAHHVGPKTTSRD